MSFPPDGVVSHHRQISIREHGQRDVAMPAGRGSCCSGMSLLAFSTVETLRGTRISAARSSRENPRSGAGDQWVEASGRHPHGISHPSERRYVKERNSRGWPTQGAYRAHCGQQHLDLRPRARPAPRWHRPLSTPSVRLLRTTNWWARLRRGGTKVSDAAHQPPRTATPLMGLACSRTGMSPVAASPPRAVPPAHLSRTMARAAAPSPTFP